MKNKKFIFILLIILVGFLVLSIFFKYRADENKNDKYKNISITIVYKNSDRKQLNVKTKEKYLGNEMKNQKLISESQFKSGFYTEIDNEKTNYEKDKSWWCIKKNGQMIMTGMNKQIIEDGDNFDIIYTVD